MRRSVHLAAFSVWDFFLRPWVYCLGLGGSGFFVREALDLSVCLDTTGTWTIANRMGLFLPGHSYCSHTTLNPYSSDYRVLEAILAPAILLAFVTGSCRMAAAQHHGAVQA